MLQYTYNGMFPNIYDYYPDSFGNDSIIVHPRPDVVFTGEYNICINETYIWDGSNSSIDNLSHHPQCIQSYEWETVQVIAGTPQLPWISIGTNSSILSHSFSTSGEWIVRLTCTSDNQCSNTWQETIIVNDLPNASFTSQYTPGCAQTTVSFDGSNSSTTILEWEWDFGNGQSFNSTSAGTYNGFANTTYLTPSSTYTVSLVVTDNNSCISNPAYQDIFIALSLIHISEPTRPY